MAVVTFEDGPAQHGQPAEATQMQLAVAPVSARAAAAAHPGLVLSLRRLPVFLRVVHDVERDTWDALDQPADEPSAGETVWIYARAGYGHVRKLGRFASYRLLPMPASVRSMARSNELWRELVETFPLPDTYMPTAALHG